MTTEKHTRFGCGVSVVSSWKSFFFLSVFDNVFDPLKKLHNTFGRFKSPHLPHRLGRRNRPVILSYPVGRRRISASRPWTRAWAARTDTGNRRFRTTTVPRRPSRTIEVYPDRPPEPDRLARSSKCRHRRRRRRRWLVAPCRCSSRRKSPSNISRLCQQTDKAFTFRFRARRCPYGRKTVEDRSGCRGSPTLSKDWATINILSFRSSVYF